MYSVEGRYEEIPAKDHTLEVIESLDVSAEEAARLFARYCTGERLARQEKRYGNSANQPIASKQGPRQTAPLRTLERVTFEDVISGEFTS